MYQMTPMMRAAPPTTSKVLVCEPVKWCMARQMTPRRMMQMPERRLMILFIDIINVNVCSKRDSAKLGK